MLKRIVLLFILVNALFLYGDDVLTIVKGIPYYEEGMEITGEDTAYARERCKLDVSHPKKQGKYPVLVWFHGGGLSGGGKHFPSVISRNNVVVVAVNYRLYEKGGKCPDYIYDAAAAVAWTFKHVAEYQGDTDRIYISGHSAGGYLTAMLALDGKYLGKYGFKPQQVAAYFPVSGQMSTHFCILRERRKENPATPEFFMDDMAPLMHTLPDKNMRFYAIVGDTDIEWPARVEENLLLCARLRRIHKCPNVKCYCMPSFTHGTVVQPACAFIDNFIKNDVKKTAQ